MADYKVTPDETRQIAEAFLKVNPSLKPQWGNKIPAFGSGYNAFDGGVPEYEEFRDPNSPLWVVRFEDPMGGRHYVDHEVVLKGLSVSVYEDDTMESTFISTWVMLQTVEERQLRHLPAWGPSRIVQLGLFSGATVRFPYQGHSLLDSGPEEQLKLLAPSKDTSADAAEPA
ncbi:hypothetical protein ACIO6T_30705 [Streptomyces sp. NPDC087532]|uniref:hypothetical protein n=1 Tax=Streptomyces sp. NPDC087532 TaxID=3365795 RepID=UPI0038220063